MKPPLHCFTYRKSIPHITGTDLITAIIERYLLPVKIPSTGKINALTCRKAFCKRSEASPDDS
jgi:hypothetical protein